jgi:hypothetical protein
MQVDRMWEPWQPLWVRKNGKNVEVRWGDQMRRQQGDDMHATARRILPDYPWDYAFYSEWASDAGVYVYTEFSDMQAVGRAIMVRCRSPQTATAYRTGANSVTVKAEGCDAETRARMAVDAMLAQCGESAHTNGVKLFPYNSGYMAVLYGAAQEGASK